MYSLPEVLEDIKEFEKMSVRLEQTNSNSKFTKLYSDFYKEPAGSNLPVDKFFSKIDNYVFECLIKEN